MSEPASAKTGITGGDLRTLNKFLPEPRADLYAAVLAANAWPIASLNSPRRICNFLGQTAEETGGFISLVESTAYKDADFLVATFKNVHGLDHANRLITEGAEAIGNTIYAFSNGNGDVASGDGYRFRGRGFLQITGRANYRQIGALVKLPLEDNPDMLANPTTAAIAAATYWKEYNINVAADADDVGTVTQLVNGSSRLHQSQRQQWHDKARQIWTF